MSSKTVKRFGVSLESGLLSALDKLAVKNKLPNRSQAIRFLIRNNLVEESWQKNSTVAGCVVLVYDHHKRDLINKALKIQHNFSHLILSSQHQHLDHDSCMEMIALKGRAKELRELADSLIALKGIKHGKLVVSTIK